MITTEKSLWQVLEILKKRGYTNDYNLLKQNQSFTDDNQPVRIQDLVIEKVYRFAPLDDADDDSVLYAIKNTKDDSKGVFVNGYGVSSDPKNAAIIDQIPLLEIDPDVDWTK
ncbi:hypothetical protein [Myroides sp. LJL110]